MHGNNSGDLFRIVVSIANGSSSNGCGKGVTSQVEGLFVVSNVAKRKVGKKNWDERVSGGFDPDIWLKQPRINK